ncbi:MAG: PKD domain-containing protein, partial [Candidatus Diapherotrites archaeon]|nr:PKD domain-containing protein [Candidatus Diapherotrites archaeon]
MYYGNPTAHSKSDPTLTLIYYKNFKSSNPSIGCGSWLEQGKWCWGSHPSGVSSYCEKNYFTWRSGYGIKFHWEECHREPGAAYTEYVPIFNDVSKKWYTMNPDIKIKLNLDYINNPSRTRGGGPTFMLTNITGIHMNDGSSSHPYDPDNASIIYFHIHAGKLLDGTTPSTSELVIHPGAQHGMSGTSGITCGIIGKGEHWIELLVKKNKLHLYLDEKECGSVDVTSMQFNKKTYWQYFVAQDKQSGSASSTYTTGTIEEIYGRKVLNFEPEVKIGPEVRKSDLLEAYGSPKIIEEKRKWALTDFMWLNDSSKLRNKNITWSIWYADVFGHNTETEKMSFLIGGGNNAPNACFTTNYTGNTKNPTKIDARIGSTVEFDGSCSLDPDPGDHVDTYTWRYSGTPTYKKFPNNKTVFTFNNQGEFQVCLSVNDTKGLFNSPPNPCVMVNVSANTPPIAYAHPSKITGAVYQCQVGGNVLLDGSASSDPDGTIASWEWDVGGWTGSGETVSYPCSTGGDNVVTLTVTDNDGATGDDYAIVRAISPPKPAKLIVKSVQPIYPIRPGIRSNATVTIENTGQQKSGQYNITY